MTDPLRDPRFPDRPQHADFWRLSEIMLFLDGETKEGGKSPAEVIEGLIDKDALDYMADQRVQMFVQALHAIGLEIPSTKENMQALAVMMINGVVAGILFQQKGGHRDA